MLTLTYLAHSKGVLVSGPANVERIIGVIVTPLDSSSGDVTWGGNTLGRASSATAAICLQILPLEASTQAKSQLRGATRIWGEREGESVCISVRQKYLHRTPPDWAPPHRRRCSSSCGPGWPCQGRGRRHGEPDLRREDRRHWTLLPPQPAQECRPRGS